MKKMFGKHEKNIGAIAFLVGVFGSLLLGLLAGLNLFQAGLGLTVVLVIAGILIGLFHIPKEKTLILMVIALVLGLGSAGFSVLPAVGGILKEMLTSLASVMIPAGITVAVKTLVYMRK